MARENLPDDRQSNLAAAAAGPSRKWLIRFESVNIIAAKRASQGPLTGPGFAGAAS